MVLQGKTAIITGAGSGIGAGIAVAMARQGVSLLICGRRAASLEHTATRIRAEGGTVVAMPADISQEDDVQRLAAAAADHFQAVDYLVNNAGIGGGGQIHQHTVSDWDRVMAVNLRGPFLMCRAFLPGMRQARGGHVINISSESAMEHYPGNGAYGVSKHGLNALGEYIQRENQALGIRVDTICPGMVVTEMSEHAPGLDHDKCLYPDDIAELVLWLISRRSNIKIGRPILIQTMENPWG